MILVFAVKTWSDEFTIASKTIKDDYQTLPLQRSSI